MKTWMTKRWNKGVNNFRKNKNGVLLCFTMGWPAWFMGEKLPIVGGPLLAILLGILVGSVVKERQAFSDGIKFTSKKILEVAVILLGFGLNLSTMMETGKQSQPIIIGTITVSLVMAFVLHKIMRISSPIATLIGVGSAICGGSAIAATSQVIDASEEEVAQAISVIFFFNLMAALIFPTLGAFLGFSTISGEAFGIFAGTAVNDTSSVTAVATTWDHLYQLGSATLDKAVTVKLTRTLAIIPITLVLAFVRSRKSKDKQVDFMKIFPFFIIYFILASVMTTVLVHFGVPLSVFYPLKQMSKFFIIMAMVAIGFNTNLVKLVRTGGKPIIMGLICWLSIIGVSLVLQKSLGIW